MKMRKKYGITLKLLQIFDEYDYPLSISTKGVFFTRDERYMELIRKHPHNWHFKISIITANEFKSRAIERGCPTVNERIEAIRVLAEAGIHVTLRLRPYKWHSKRTGRTFTLIWGFYVFL
jgi:DNA repair photolyase